ncbi:cofactor-independent phosphoglycerate mutase [Muricomes intestini]|uniref:2,3-bisphosphoglycerate-independent phosphoglycerate mutase n=1 Tax=Muricomes intestini TaxID=1796634 RepID=A0A4R3KC70_9FIRM|nr:cofactor-independent phosphoglycerate mutase [Muricomes intestini]TCS80678.1 2,3-bisphosphoglycerate-independent phosphoglycerate mutase [Muricomes intestini]HAX50863.1 cofactor-independent phosphoglycerate mutase [Lachnospiraceae bacterium]HCR83173.1 cofactor-independent phosphoglycerate mutase [Lachnospiraceae bacterium]
MKYIIVLCDGMADEPLGELGGKTPLGAAKTPNMDVLAPKSEIGMVRTVPEGMAPGSDTANLSVIGYDPRRYYTGRSPLEALSIGVDMEPSDVAFRCNLVTLTEEQDTYEDRIITDHSSGEISTEDASVLMDALKKGLAREGYEFYVGTSYRHLLVQKQGKVVELTPPHDILTRRIGDYLPKEPVLREMMEKSYEILSLHPLNIERKKNGKNSANSAWFWGAGTRPALTSFEEKNKKRGAMISAVDLLKGIAAGAGMHNIPVKGANGGLDTNYAGKAQAAVDALLREGYDFVYIHIEAPDEMGHQGSAENKIKAIENIDAYIIGSVTEALKAAGEEFRMLILPDHPTPVRIRTHTKDPVPYLLYDSRHTFKGMREYNEETASQTGILEEEGYTLITHLFDCSLAELS